MFTKAGKHFADWTDATGRRIRKSFTSKAKAIAHENAMKEISRQTRPHPARGQSPVSSRQFRELASPASQPSTHSSNSKFPAVISGPQNGGRIKSSELST